MKQDSAKHLGAKTIKPLIFLEEVKGEMKKVDWPSKPAVIKLTGIVVAVSVGVALFLGAF